MSSSARRMQETDWDSINLAMLNEVQPGPGAGASSQHNTGGGDFNILDHEPYFVRQDLLYIQPYSCTLGNKSSRAISL